MRYAYVLLAFVLAACSDYANRYETVALHAGDAVQHNLLLHQADHFNPDSLDVAIDTDGERAADAVKRYRNSQKPGQKSQNNVTVNITN